MDRSLPANVTAAYTWEWEQYKPYYDDLLERSLSAETVDAWLRDLTTIDSFLSEMGQRLNVAITCDTTDEQAEAAYLHYIENIAPSWRIVHNQIDLKLLQSGLVPEGMTVPLRAIRSGVEIFREQNVPLMTELEKLSTEYDKIRGAQTVMWEGEERTLDQMYVIFQDDDRARREQAFLLMMDRQLQDREALNALWTKMYDLRQQIARNAGFDHFMQYQWQAMGRHDYTPQDAVRFHDSIAQVVVPAASRIYARRQQALKLDALRPWDLDVDVSGKPPLKPFETIEQLIDGSVAIFDRVHPDLGRYFAIMGEEDLLDLDNRKGKAPGGYCTWFAVAKRPFIFMNSVGIHDDVQTMLHEAGHCFHAFDSGNLPYGYQQDAPLEFCEVASMAMELLAAPYLTRENGGFYSAAEAARARTEHLERSILFWPYMAVVDAFQHWVYSSGQGGDPAACDAKWAELYRRFLPGVEYSGFDNWLMTGWHRKGHIYQVPFYYIEYGLAQLGAVQVWANSLRDAQQALADYRSALHLGGTVTLPQLFEAAGAKLAFDADTLGMAIDLMERTLGELGAVAS